jgi:hypothetical protein
MKEEGGGDDTEGGDDMEGGDDKGGVVDIVVKGEIEWSCQ